MALRYAIMTALLEDELSGYDLARSFDKSLGFFWHASHQQIYRELRRLRDEGWATGRQEAQQGRPDRVVYGLTEAGRDALAAWVVAGDRMRLQETKDDFYVKLYNLSRDNIGMITERVQVRREAMMERLYLYERIRRRHYDDPDTLPLRRKGVYLALLGGIMSGRQYLAWCDEALEVLARASEEIAEPAP